jgi:F420-non-reducing hydrogenase large subunit
MASTRALDSLYKVSPPPAAVKIRELVYSAFMAEDHALHFYFLGGPDFIVGPRAPAAERNILGVIAKVGKEAAQRLIDIRSKLRRVIAIAGGKAIHPVFGVPGGVTKCLTRDDAREIQAIAREAVDFAKMTLCVFETVVLGNSDYVGMIRSDAYTHKTYYMGLVDQQNRAAFYDGILRVVGPDGHEWARFKPEQYRDYIEERTEPWTYMKVTYLKPLGWTGYAEGPASGVYCVGPLARMNASEGMSTPLAHEAYLKFHGVLGGRPVHYTLATHWARLVELLYAAERLQQLANDPDITSLDIRALPTEVPDEGIGVVEAPRGTLFHHYRTDADGIITAAELIVATQNNAARIGMSIDKAARKLIQGGSFDDGILNSVEMAFRAYDPCFGCATHSLPGSMPLTVRVSGPGGVRTLRRNRDGTIDCD